MKKAEEIIFGDKEETKMVLIFKKTQ